jgi:hypothetical protein
MSEGAKRIAAERQRQITAEGWTPDHDDEHEDGELAWAAVCYAAPRPVFRTLAHPCANEVYADPWPHSWARKWDKRPRTMAATLRPPTLAERIRMLEKAGALLAAEIDRLLREAA